MTNIALILSGGAGLRAGTEIPKQYIEAGGRPVISYCIETFEALEEIDYIQIVAEPEWYPFIEKEQSDQTSRERTARCLFFTDLQICFPQQGTIRWW